MGKNNLNFDGRIFAIIYKYSRILMNMGIFFYGKEGQAMPVSIEMTGEVLTCRLSGELDHHAAMPIRQEIDKAIEEERPTLVILDFGDLSFMDSSGIGLVMGRSNTTKAVGAQLHVCNLSNQIYKVMKLSGIDRIAVVEKGSDLK